MSEKTSNYFENNLSSEWVQNENNVFEEFLINKIVTLSNHIWNKVKHIEDEDENNIYSGNVGIAFMFWYLSQQKTFESFIDCDAFLSRARTLMTRSLKSLEISERLDKSHSFFFGNSGICLIAGLIFDSCGDIKSRDHYLNLFVKFSSFYLSIDFDDSLRDTLFDGRAGFICGALIANQKFSSHIIPVQMIQNIGISVIKSGKFDALMCESNLPILYETLNGVGIDMGRGMSGILLSLLCIPDLKLLHPDFEPHIKTVVDYILSKQRPNGSYISDDLDSDPINWCSGSTGVCYLMAKAYQLWSENKYKNSMIKFAELLWQRGLSRKGPGISTGISGNGYLFLILYQWTGDQKYLNRAKQFAQFIFDEKYLEQCLAPEKPYSLMEGWAGTVCFLVALLSGQRCEQRIPLFLDIFNEEKTQSTEDFAELSESLKSIESIDSNKIQNKSIPE